MRPNEWRKQVAKVAEEFGGEVVIRNNGHLKIVLPNGRCVFCSQSASDHRAIHKVRGDCRREAAR